MLLIFSSIVGEPDSMRFRASFSLDILGWRLPCPFAHSVRESCHPNTDSVQLQLVETGNSAWQHVVSRCSVNGG